MLMFNSNPRNDICQFADRYFGQKKLAENREKLICSRFLILRFGVGTATHFGGEG